ncbi:MAG TPA: carboxypeptidase regulatory-like domain-containing protein [Terriglobales bacterium]|nr:carboxypeptidase regulatory-like domain-containing protein [Terriglobales bacterium]
MARKLVLGFMLFSLLLSFTLPAIGQASAESAVKGNVAGLVTDPSGAVVPGAKITLGGPTGTRTATTDGQGGFMFLLLTPGNYTVRVEKEGFKAAELRAIDVVTNRTTNLKINLLTGTVSETVEVNAAAITVDTTSSAVSSNLSNDFYEKVPVGRGVASIFYIAPGVASGGGSGTSNPSISGGSGLENQYVADGVNITDTAFGGLGTFSRVYGSVGTGINLSFVKEVEVKTGGYEPQYGKTTGGVVQIVTKSGSNEYHGAISAFIQPKGFEETRLNPDQFGLVNKLGDLRHLANYDVTGELGGYVPGFKTRLFFFGSVNPSWADRIVRAPDNAGLFALGDLNRRATTMNYAAKLTWRLTDSHQFEGSVFGDPTTTNTSAFRRLTMDNKTAFSTLDYGSRNTVVRYNGSMSPTWVVNASATWAHNHFKETGFGNFQEIRDETQTAGLPGQRGLFVPVGLGFVEPTTGENYGLNLDTSKTFHAGGEHTFSIGYRFERPFYDGSRTNSGPTFNLPATVADGTTGFLSPDFVTVASTPNLSLANAFWRLVLAPSSCTLCPFMNVPGFAGQKRVVLRIFRSEFGLNSQGVKPFKTSGKYHAAYINDAWSPNRYVTMNIGLRWEQQLMHGQDLTYTFRDNWSPRVGITVDPKGDRKNKIFANFGRYTYAIPLDLAERSLTNEFDMFGMRVTPQFTVDGSGKRIVTINQLGTVTPPNPITPADVLNGAFRDPNTGDCLNAAPAPCGVGNAAAVSFESIEPIHTGTKMSYLDEFVVGAEHEFPAGVIASVKFLRRDLKRIVEDTGGISPEAALAGVTQQFAITNVNAATDIFTNPIQFITPPGGTLPSSCTSNPNSFILNGVTDTFGNNLGNVCVLPNGVNGQPAGGLVPDGIPDGYTNPIRQYTAVEFEVNKAFSKNWLLRTNWRIAKIYGNFEGAFRNDNGQTDPSISSLFDFTPGQFGLLGDQFKPGVLNTDRRHIVNAFFSYYLDHTALKGLTLGTGVQFQSGIPINDLKAHPVYDNSGEVPVGGRGHLGRTPFTGTVDAHVDYAHSVTERSTFHIGVDLFNIANARRNQFVDQNEDLSFGTPNVDFLKPTNQAVLGDAFQAPFSARLSVRFVF